MLQYIHPHATYGHKATFIDDTDELLMYGGATYKQEQPPTYDNQASKLASYPSTRNP